MTMKKRITSFALVLLMVLSSLAVLLPVTGVKAAAAGETKTYTKVTTAPTDWSGTYIIVYEKSATEGYVFTGVDAVNGYETATIADGKITIAATATITIAKFGDDYSILISGNTNDGKYMGYTAKKNGMNFSPTAIQNNITMTGGKVEIKSGTAPSTLKFNNSSDQMRFRYFASGQQAIQLYKLESTCNHTPDTAVSVYTKGTDTANHYFKCATCGEEYSVAHSSDTYHLTQDKSQHYQVCDVCNAEFNKGEHHVTAWTDTTDGANHSGTCEDCKNPVTKAHVVDTTKWEYDADNHWHECSECGAQLEKAAHDPKSDCEICGRSAAAGDVAATFKLGEDGAASHSETTKAASSYKETSGGYTLEFSSLSNVYVNSRDAKGNGCLKLGTGSKTGSFTFTVPNDVMSVVIYVAKYKATATTVTINGTNYTITKASDDGEYDEIKIDTSVTRTVTFSTTTSGKRCMINTIEFYAKPKAEAPKFEYATLDVKENIDVNFYVSVPNGYDVANLKTFFNFHRADTSVVGEPVNTENGLLYRFTLKDVAPHLMGENITATLKNGDTVIASLAYSINTYLDNQKKDTTLSDSTKALIESIAAYGDKAADYNNKISDSTTFTGTATADPADMTESKPTIGTTLEGFRFKGVAVRMENNIRIRVSFVNTSGAELKFFVKVGDGEETEAILSNGYVYTDLIAPSAYDTEYTIIAKNAGGETVGTVSLSVNTYVFMVLKAFPADGTLTNAQAAMRELAIAIYNYGKAAKTAVGA